MKRRVQPTEEEEELSEIIDKFAERLDPDLTPHSPRHRLSRLTWHLRVLLFRRLHISDLDVILKAVFFFYVLIMVIALLGLVFMGLYMIKTWAGIDLIPGFHLLS